MSYVQQELNQCCGCSACANICPKNAIQLVQNEKGFYYPYIDESKCIQCNLCKKVCNFSVFNKKNITLQESYAVRHRELNELMTSRSGGFFSGLADYVLSQQGVVYGAALDSDCKVVHMKAETKVDIDRFKGSKYVQSYIANGLFLEIVNEMKAGRLVLFSGSGCQVHGLIQFLKTKKMDTTNLITVDFVCHGVPSPKVWSDYLEKLSAINGKRIVSVNFRNKQLFGWSDHKETYIFADGSELSNSAWAEVFYLHCMFRDSCYVCPYTTPIRESDFTIGDYCGLSEAAGEDLYADNKGVSLVICQNVRAKEILYSMNNVFEITRTDLSKSMQPQLKRAVYKGPEYGKFWRMYLSDSRKAINTYFFPNYIMKFYIVIYKKAKVVAKKILKFKLK